MADDDLKEQIAEQNRRKLQEHLAQIKKHKGVPPKESSKPSNQTRTPNSGRGTGPKADPGKERFRQDWEAWKRMYGGRVIDLRKQKPQDLGADYKLLGIPQTAKKDEIRKAFYKLAKQSHPDQGGDPEKFRALMEAYARLSGNK